MKKLLFKDEINQSGYVGVLETARDIEQALALSCSTTSRGKKSKGEAILSI